MFAKFNYCVTDFGTDTYRGGFLGRRNASFPTSDEKIENHPGFKVLFMVLALPYVTNFS